MKRFFLFILLLAACKKPYNPPVSSSPQSYLVVEGVINTGSDSTIFNISRTVPLSGSTTSAPELNAALSIESDQSASYQLSEIGNGRYSSANLNLNNGYKYRLRIKTTSGKEYLSDMVAVKINPQIDSIGYTVLSNGVQIYSNTHDETNSTRYYRWDYNETWQFHSMFNSGYIATNTEVVPRTDSQKIYFCYGNDMSDNIILGSSAALLKDVIYKNPITLIPSTSEKIEVKYSILLKQYALTKEAFDFWENIKNNTEKLGSIFDVQPSQTTGNIHSVTDPSELVIGYVSATNVQSRRIFITNEELPKSFVTAYPYSCVQQDSALYFGKMGENQVLTDLVWPPRQDIPTGAIEVNGNIIGYLKAAKECVDCTIRGKTEKPDFWK